MGIHNLFHKMNTADKAFPAGTSTIKGLCNGADGYLFGYGTGAPLAAAAGFAKGCIYIRTDGSAGTMTYVNEGSNTSATWVASPTTGAARTESGAITLGAGATVSTTQSLTVITADKLTVGGIIVPQDVPLCQWQIRPSATTSAGKLQTAFTARDAWTVTKVDYAPDVAEGAALTATLNKATGTTAPTVAVGLVQFTTTSFDVNGSANIVQVGTLASGASTANLSVTAGDRLCVVLSNGPTSAYGMMSVRGKRI